MSELNASTGILDKARADTYANKADDKSVSADGLVAGLAKAWVNYDAVLVTIRDSFNVSSITDNATGDFTVNFTNALPNANYSALGMTSSDGSTTSFTLFEENSSGTRDSATTTSLKVQARTGGGTAVDQDSNNVAIFSN